MQTRDKVRYSFYALLVLVALPTLYVQLTDSAADNGAACALIGVVLLFIVEFGYAFADRTAKRRDGR